VAERRRISIEGLALLLAVSAAGIAGMLVSIPRAVTPHETMGLHFADDDARENFAKDEAAIAALPAETELAEEQRLYAELNAIEAGVPGAARELTTTLEGETERLASAFGDDAIDALRCDAAHRLAADLARETDDPERAKRLGGFEGFLDRYSARRDSRITAPPIVVRTIFKARWNLVHGLEATDGLRPLELRVYWGWLALEATDVEAPRRISALERYAEASGEDVREARATLEIVAGHPDEAAKLYRELREEGENLRLRNHELAALVDVTE
jgi:hypothetical protein